MKSSRLPHKAILPIGGMPSVERCLESCLKFPFVELVVLATSDLEEDAVLERHTLGEKARFWKGDPNDVIGRYLGACDEYGIDVIVRVTADCPVVSSEIADILIRSHFAEGADFTCGRQFAVGSNSEVYNAESLRRIIQYLGKASYSEYMSFYMMNNPDLFKLNIVDLPEHLVRDYRLTLDYQEDLDMFNRLYGELQQRTMEVNLPNVFAILDSLPEIPKMNAHLPLVYRTDQQLIATLNKVCRIDRSKLPSAISPSS
jgi:N,N'-diacetyllegionaminate synthase